MDVPVKTFTHWEQTKEGSMPLSIETELQSLQILSISPLHHLHLMNFCKMLICMRFKSKFANIIHYSLASKEFQLPKLWFFLTKTCLSRHRTLVPCIASQDELVSLFNVVTAEEMCQPSGSRVFFSPAAS